MARHQPPAHETPKLTPRSTQDRIVYTVKSTGEQFSNREVPAPSHAWSNPDAQPGPALQAAIRASQEAIAAMQGQPARRLLHG